METSLSVEDEVPQKTITTSSIEDLTLRQKLGEGPELKSYFIRWPILILFVLYSMSNAFQWIQFSIINDIVSRYYGVSSNVVDMTSMIYMISYIPLIFPATYLLEKKGLRVCVLIGSFGTALGSWIKVFSASQHLFYVAFIGQTVVAMSQIFVLGIPPMLAATWFGADQVSTACSIGVFGNQLGVAAGFLLPPLLVRNGSMDEIGRDLQNMFYGTGALTALLFILIIFVFKDKPDTPPSLARAAVGDEEESYVQSMKNLINNKGYILLLTSYGINVGVFYAISTLLSDFVLRYFPNNYEDTGGIGLCIVLSGTVGSAISGIILDKTRMFKETTLIIYILSFVGMVVYTFTLPYGNSIILLYIVCSALGFFMTGYLPVGFEFAAEITYPESEGTSSGLLNASAQVFGLILTPITRAFFESSLGATGANIALCAALIIGAGMTAMIRADLKRTSAQKGAPNENGKFP